MATTKLEDTALKVFQLACTSAREQVTQGISNGITSQEIISRAQDIWKALQQARIFVVKPEDWESIYDASDKYTCALNNLEQNPFTEKLTEESDARNFTGAKRLISYFLENSCTIPFPSKLPFNSIFVCFGDEVSLSWFQAHMRVGMSAIDANAIIGMLLYGFLLYTSCDGDQIYDVIYIKTEEEKSSGTAFFQSYDSRNSTQLDGPWIQPTSLNPWTLPILVEAINDKEKLTLEVPGLAAKMARKAFLKRHPGFLPVPMPFYTVKTKDGFVEGCVAKLPHPGRSLEWSHRWDVRGHDCVRVQLGTLPLDPRIEKKLKKRNYRIYTETVAQDDLELLMRRGVVRRPDEWVAVLTYHRDAHIKGPEGKPYVPAVRVL